MAVRDLVEAWGLLVALSLGTVLLSSLGQPAESRTLISAGLLLLAGCKARVILARYLGLARSRFWTRAFDLAIGLFLAASFALYALGAGGAP